MCLILQPAHVFIRGNPNNPGALAPPQFLTCLGGGDDKVFRDGSGRLELAQAIIDPDNPLTARVIVNRVWMHHFGFGLVRTPSDFGFRGDPPTHPELLDYLAVKFVRIRLVSEETAPPDHDLGRLSAGQRRQRGRAKDRSGESVAMADEPPAAGDREPARFACWPSRAGWISRLAAFRSHSRRSPRSRGVRSTALSSAGAFPALLSAFDFASPDQHAPMRFVTTVPQQALFFLNSPFVAEQASALANRPEIAAQLRADRKRSSVLYRCVFGRAPEQRELEAGLRFVSQKRRRTAAAHAAVAVAVWHRRVSMRTTGGLSRFTPFAVFVSDRWQGGADTAGITRRQGGAARGWRRTG